MTRVPRRGVPARAARARSRIPKPKIRKHKIIMESVTQEKKKLRSVISFEAKAPPGYTFIPAGNPQFTNACKEYCRKEGHKVFTVSTTPHQRTHDLSQQVHRIGYHFPSVAVATLCMEQGLYVSSTGKVLPYQQGSTHNFGNRFISGRKADSELSQTTINSEARDAIKDLFPNIPRRDLSQIIKTAFQKGKRKVGTAAELPLARRVQLAVVAHIRHLYTDYDRLLRLTSFQEARTAVEEPTLAKLVQWRGDDENGKVELEDVFREVIVISDNEDEEIESDTGVLPGERDSSVEIVSSNTLVGELQTRPLNYGTRPSVDRQSAHEQSEDEAPPGFRFVPEPPRKRKPHKNKVDRRGFSRYQAWNRAIDRYKGSANLPAQSPTADALESTYQSSHIVEAPMKGPGEPDGHIHGFSGHGLPVSTRQPLPFRSQPPPQQGNFRSVNALANENQQDINVRREPPDVIRLADGTIFERADRMQIPDNAKVPSERIAMPIHHPMHSEQVKYPMSGDTHRYPARQNMIGHDQRNRVLPSIEISTSADHAESRRLDRDPLLARKRDVNAVPEDSSHHRQDVMETIPEKAFPISYRDDRQRIPQKRSKLEHGHIVHGNFNAEVYGAYSPTRNPRLTQTQRQISLPPAPERQVSVGGRPIPPATEQPSPTYRQHREDPALRLMRRPVADIQSVHGTSHKSQFADDIGEHGQPDHGRFSPRFSYRSDGPGYTSTVGEPAMRSRPVFPLDRAQKQRHRHFDEPEIRRTQDPVISDHLRSARSVSPARQYMRDQNARSNHYAPEFVRSVHWQNPKAPLGYEPSISSAREERVAPVRHVAKHPTDGASGTGEDDRYMPSWTGLHPFSSARRPNPQDPYLSSHDSGHLPFHPVQHSNINASPRRPPSDIYDSRVEILDSGRHHNVADSRDPSKRLFPTRMPIDNRSTFYRNKPARDEVFVTGG